MDKMLNLYRSEVQEEDATVRLAQETLDCWGQLTPDGKYHGGMFLQVSFVHDQSQTEVREKTAQLISQNLTIIVYNTMRCICSVPAVFLILVESPQD